MSRGSRKRLSEDGIGRHERLRARLEATGKVLPDTRTPEEREAMDASDREASDFHGDGRR